MRIMIQQPHYFPEMYLWNRMLNVDKIVVMDNVQMNRRSTQRKTPIKLNGEKYYLTVPVKGGSRQQLDEAVIGNSGLWISSLVTTLRHAYGKQPYFEEIFKKYFEWHHYRRITLISLNLEAIAEIGRHLGVTAPFLSLSSLNIDREKFRKADLILEVCRQLGATEYLCGKVSVVGDEKEEPYLNADDFHGAGIRLLGQNWKCPKYRQGKGAFIPNLSILDPLFNVGWVATYKMLANLEVEEL